MNPPPSTFAILTLGCKVNQYESQLIRERLLASGGREDRSDPRLLVVNTCAVTGRAEARARKMIRTNLREFPRARLALAGCGLAYSRLRGTDLEELVPPGRRGEIPSGVPGREGGGITAFAGRCRALVKVQDGCDAFCSYCVIPLVRGRPVSRPPAAVLEEAAGLIRAGYREIVLTGVNLGLYRADYGGRRIGLAGLVGLVCGLEGDFRVRLSSVEPGPEAGRLARLLAGEERLCPHLHLPLQSGSDRVLGLMNRQYTYRRYRELVSRLRVARPDLALTTDCLVGFPGEEEADFEKTLKAVEELGFSRVHVFPYSPRPPARSALSPPPPSRVVAGRAAVLRAAAEETGRNYRERFRGETVEVLIESASRCGRARGLERHYLRAEVAGAGLKPGMVCRARVTGIEGEVLRTVPDNLQAALTPNRGCDNK